jgi:tight adherence protein C
MLLIMMSLLIAAAVAVGAFAVYQSTVTERNPVMLRLRQLRMMTAGTGPLTTKRPPLALKLLAQLGGFLPASNGADALRTGLVRAGYRRGDAVLVLIGSKVLCAALLPVIWIAAGYAMAKPLGNVLGVSVVLGVLGFYVPTVYIGIRLSQRRGEIQSALPDALDLLVVCVEAGLGLGAALQRVGQEIRLASPQLSDELALVNSEMQTGVSRMDALRNLAERTGVEELFSLVAMLIQTDRLGTSIAMSLRAHADSMRTRRRQRAEELARKASIKLAFPLVLLIFPALMVVILGPAGIQLIKALVANQ